MQYLETKKGGGVPETAFVFGGFVRDLRRSISYNHLSIKEKDYISNMIKYTLT